MNNSEGINILTIHGSLHERNRQQYDDVLCKTLLIERPPIPKNMMVELSNACNHACLFCTNPNMTRKVSRIEAGLLKRIIHEAHDAGVEEIGFYTTGEPFVHKSIDSFVREANELGFRYIYISTNGALATPERVKSIINAGLNSIKFSINAGSRKTYRLVHGRDDWDQVMANLKFISDYRALLDRPVKLYVTFVVTIHTAHEVELFRKRVGPLVDEIMFQQVQNHAGQMIDTQKILSSLTRSDSFNTNICILPFNRLHISCEGYLTLCCVDYQNYLAVADLKVMSLTEAWQLPLFQEVRQRHLNGQLRGLLCGNCWQGFKDDVQPLVQNFATVINFPEFYRKAAAAVAKRLDEADDKFQQPD